MSCNVEPDEMLQWNRRIGTEDLNGKIILQTKRCIVRELTMDDIDALFELYGPSEITRFVEPLYEREKEMEYQRNYIREIYGGYGYGMWTVADKGSGKLIGRIGVESHPKDDADTVELGYIIAMDWQGKGIAAEVCTAVLEYAKDVLGKRRAYARIHPDNEASIRLAKKLGFVMTDEMIDGERVWEKIL